MPNQNKRYLVTYTDESISTDAAAKLLGVSEKKITDGVTFMETESIPSANDVLHFMNLGVTTIELTEDDAQILSTKDGVLAVEEDIEMFVINSDEEDEAQFNEFFMYSDNLFNETSIFQEPSNDLFTNGYEKALLDVFASILQLGISGNSKQPAQYAPSSFTPQPIPWNISLVKAPEAWGRGITGRGVKVAILDTGIAVHSDLVIAGGVSFIPGSKSFNDLDGHGTHCAGLVAARNNLSGVVGVAPDAALYAVKVLGDNGVGKSSWIIAGMEWCIRKKMKVASMSLGGPNSPMVAYSNAVKKCQENGVTVVIASGNSFGKSFPWVMSPANSIISGKPNSMPIAVGAVDSRSVIAGFSSRGGRTSQWNQVWCVAPGVSVLSTYLHDTYRFMTGTSMACPHVAGLAALIIQRYPGISPANVKRRIVTTCTDLGARGYDKTYGYGLINCDLATM